MNRFDLPFEHRTVKDSLSNTGYDSIASIIHPNMPKGLLRNAEEVFGKKFVKMGSDLYICEERSRNIKLHDYGNIISAPSTFEISGENKTEILTGGNGLSIKNKEGAPSFFLPTLRLRQGFYKLIKVRMTSPQKDILKIYYRTKDAPDYIEKNSIKYMLAKGENRFMMALPADSVGGIRIEVGSTPGNFIIDELSIGELRNAQPHDSIEL
jgi:hypothetical protein